MLRYSGRGLRLEPLEDRVTPTTLPPGFYEALVVGGLQSPTALALALDGRIFVSEQAGDLRVAKDGRLLDEPFLSLAVDVTYEQGLLGVAFDPDFESNHFVYVYYTTTEGG